MFTRLTRLVIVLLAFSGCGKPEIAFQEKSVRTVEDARKWLRTIWAVNQENEVIVENPQNVPSVTAKFDHRFGMFGSWYEFDAEIDSKSDVHLAALAFNLAFLSNCFTALPEMETWILQNVSKTIKESEEGKIGIATIVFHPWEIRFQSNPAGGDLNVRKCYLRFTPIREDRNAIDNPK